MTLIPEGTTLPRTRLHIAFALRHARPGRRRWPSVGYVSLKSRPDESLLGSLDGARRTRGERKPGRPSIATNGAQNQKHPPKRQPLVLRPLLCETLI